MQLTIQTPSRLHFSLIDLNGSLGRINGSIGVALKSPNWIIHGFDSADVANLSTIEKPTEEAIKLFDNYFETETNNLFIKIEKSIPGHVGLGSNTQFLLAIGTILAKIHNIKTTPRDIAKALKRGGTSGIGVAAFEAGGFIIDGGHSFGPGKQTESFLPSSVSKAPPPPILFRNNLPENWNFIILTPKEDIGAHGREEISLFQDKCPIPREDVEKLSRLILMKILPALVEQDIETFGEGLTDIQTISSRFGMEKYNEGISSELLEYLKKKEHVYGFGISSFGPTIYGLTNNEINAQKTIQEITELFSDNKFKLITYSNVATEGAKITIKK